MRKEKRILEEKGKDLNREDRSNRRASIYQTALIKD